MILETVTVLAILVGGSALVRTTGLRGWPLPATGFVAGTCVMIAFATVQVVLALPTTPAITLVLTLGVPVSWWLRRRHQGQDVAVSLSSSLLLGGAVIVVVAILRAAHLANFHWDSYRYLQGAGLLAGNNLDVQSFQQFETRLLSTAVIHSPAHLHNEFYVRAITPLLAAATVAILVWLCTVGLRTQLMRTDVLAVTTAAVALLVTNNRFVFHAFYINGHLVVAALLLVIAGCSWVHLRGGDVPTRALLLLQALAIPALVVTRPEGSLIAGLAVLPLVAAVSVPWRQRAALLAVTGGAIAVWHGFLLYVHAQQREGELSGALLVMTGLGVAALAAVPVLAWPRVQPRLRHAPGLVEVGLWLFLGLLTVREPRVLYDSAVATTHNAVLHATSWGLSLVVLGVLAACALLLTDATHRVHLRYPLTTFVPLVAILAYLRGGAYRIHEADSLNRMLIHIVPLAVLFVASAATSERWGPRRKGIRAAEVTYQSHAAPQG